MGDSRGLYLDLMKRCLTNSVYGPSEPGYDPEVRARGADWPPTAHTMIGLKRLNHLQRCIEQVLEEKVPGDVIETGIWRGGAVIFMRAVLKAYQAGDRSVWAADSFEGLPNPNGDKYPADANDGLHNHKALAVPFDQVKANFEAYGLLDPQVRFLKGWFRDTLPAAPIERLAILRLDGDMYESTIDPLVHLYPKVSPGGFIIVDDYVLEGCRKAVHDYREAHGITSPIEPIDWCGSYWRKA